MLRRIVPACGALLAALALFTAAAHAQTAPAIPGGVYSITLVDTTGGCSEGDFTVGPATTLRLNPHGTRISELIASDVRSPIGFFSRAPIPVRIPIDSEGRFDGTFDPWELGVVMVHLEGTFVDDSVSGTFSVVGVDALECAGTFSGPGESPPTRPPVRYGGRILLAAEDCGPGDLTLTVSGDGLSLIEIHVEGVAVHGVQAGGNATLAVGTVPIAENGSFGWTYFPGSDPGQEIALIGSVETLGNIQGWLTVSPSTCGAMPFVSAAPTGLGQGGTGRPADSGVALAWALAAAAFGVAALAAGAALRRKER